MAPVVEGLSALAPVHTTEAQSGSAGPLNGAEAGQLLDELAEMIEEMDPDAEEKVAEISSQMAGQADQQLLRKLAQQVGGFEFDEAAETLSAVRASLKQPPGPEEIKPLLDELAAMIEEMDHDAEEKVEEISSRVGAQLDGQLLRQLAQQVGGFEFDEAAETLEKIRADMDMA